MLFVERERHRGNSILKSEVKTSIRAKRTKAEQEVLALIAPLGKLGRFEEATDFFQANV